MPGNQVVLTASTPIGRGTPLGVTSASTNDIWIAWTNATSSTVMTPDPWPIWIRHNSSGTASTLSSTAASTSEILVSGSTAIVWDAWSTSYIETSRRLQQEFRQHQQACNTPQYEQQRLQVEGEQKAARERAAQLLQEHLSVEQRAELADKGYFTLKSIDKTGRVRHYQIRKGFQRNIHEVEPASGKRLNTICAHPSVRVPDEDTMLIQKFMLESPEGHDDFLQVANVSPYFG